MRTRSIAPLLLALGACGGGPRPDLLLVTIDTMRHDHVSAAGFPRAATPALDGLAAEGAVFLRHYTVANVTGPAHAALFTGLHPRENGVRRNGHGLHAAFEPLAETLADEGYRTAAFVGAAVLGSAFGFDRGFALFDETFDLGEYEWEGRTLPYERDAASVVDRAIDHLSAPGGAPEHVWVHLFDPHLDHRRPRDEWPPAAELGELPAPTPAHPRERIVELRRGYLAEVRHADRQVGRLLAAWDARPGGRESLVLVTADHGEALGDHDYTGHSRHLYEEQLRVPLLVRMPGRVPAGTRVEAVTSSIDLRATVLELLGVGPPGGRGLLRHLESPGRARGTVAVAERQALLARRAAIAAGDATGGGELGVVAVVSPRWKYLWVEDGPDELYDLSADPGELVDVSAAEPERRAELRRIAERWRATVPLAIVRGADVPEGREDLLRRLGYAGE